jgi:hypothetical protein
MRCLGILAVSAFLLAAGASSALAISVFTLDGEPVEGGSWTQKFKLVELETDIDVDITSIKALITYPGTAVNFSNPAFVKPSGEPSALPSGWTQTRTSGTEVSAQGTAVTVGDDLRFALQFPNQNKQQTPDFTLTLTAYAGGPDYVLAGEAAFAWSQVGGGWLEVPVGPDPGGDPGSSVPEPVTMAGLLLGIGGLSGYIRRRRRA